MLTISGTPNWAVNQWVYASGTRSNHHYLFFRTGALEGHSFPVIENTSDSVTLDAGGVSLAGVTSGDGFRIVPFWSLGTLFPAGDAGLAFSVTTDPLSPQTQVWLSDPSSVGVNPIPSAYFFHAGAWRQAGQDLAISRNDQPIRPGTPLRIRNGANGGVLVVSGAVVREKQALVLRTQVGAEQDNEVALLRPVAVSLNESGLASSGAFLGSTHALARGDLLMVFEPTEVQLGKPPAHYFFYQNGAWRKLGHSLNVDFGNEPILAPNSGFVIRKAATTTGASQVWLNRPSY